VKYYTIAIKSYTSDDEPQELCEFAEMHEVIDAIRGDAVASWDVVVDPASGRAHPLVGIQEAPYYVQVTKQGRRRCVAKLSATYKVAQTIAETFFTQLGADAHSTVRQDQLPALERDRCERELSEGPVDFEQWSADAEQEPTGMSAAAVSQHAR
jgi:hypothetical protein